MNYLLIATNFLLQYVGRYRHFPTYCNMSAKDTEMEKTLREVNRRGLTRPGDLDNPSARMQLVRLCRQGKIRRIARGVYAPSEAQLSESYNLAVSSLLVPKAVVCLISALYFHDLTTQIPWEVWLAIPQDSRTPKISDFHVHYVWFPPNVLEAGVDIYTIDGVEVKIFNPGKTVVDCFSYRNKIGMDVCLEALREGWRRNLFTMDELWSYANMCRVKTVLRPYLEALE